MPRSPAVNKTKAAKPLSCADCPLRKMQPFRALTTEELAFISGLKSGELAAEPGMSILLEGQNSAHLYTVLSGWAFRYKMLPDGRRQILNFALPGDFLGLQSAMLNEMDHSVEALSPMVLCVFPRQKIWTLYADHPGLAFDLTWLGSREERFIDEILLSVGRRSAIERIAQLLVMLFDRCRRLKMTAQQVLKLPLTQQHLADALGLSIVHTNKTIRRLADMGLFQWKDGVFQILDEDRLRQIARFETHEDGKRPII